MGMIVEIVAVGLAVGYLLVAWRDGSIFEPVIGWLEDGMLVARLDEKLGKTGWHAASYVTDLLLCPLCLSPWMCLSIHLVRNGLAFESVLLAFASAAVGFGFYKKFSLSAEN